MRPSRNTVTSSQICCTSSSLWLTNKRLAPSSRELAQQAKQNLGLLRRQRGRRLVEQQDARAQRKRLGDLDELHLRDVELRDRRARVEIELENLEPAARLGMDGVVIDRAQKSAAEAFEQYVFADGEARNEIALLMDDADAGGDRIARTLEADGRAVEPQLALVRPIDAGDDLDQRRFAGAVLAEQRVDRAAAHRQRHVLQRQHAGEGLLNPARLQAERRTHAALATLWNLTSRSRLTPTAQRISRPSTTCDEVGIDVKDHQRLRDDRDDHDAEQCAEDADMSAGERRAADDGSGERKDQPIVADRGLSELQARDQHDPGERGEKAGNARAPK